MISDGPEKDQTGEATKDDGAPAPAKPGGQLTTRKVRLKGKQARFLVAFADSGGSITAAARAIGTCRDRHYHWLDEYPDYAKAYHDAVWAALEDAEVELKRRAMDGVEENVYYQKDLLETKRVYSDALLLVHIKRLSRMAGDPGRYAEQKHVEVHSEQKVLQVNIETAALSPNDQQARAKQLMADLVDQGIMDKDDVPKRS